MIKTGYKHNKEGIYSIIAHKKPLKKRQGINTIKAIKMRDMLKKRGRKQAAHYYIPVSANIQTLLITMEPK